MVMQLDIKVSFINPWHMCKGYCSRSVFWRVCVCVCVCVCVSATTLAATYMYMYLVYTLKTRCCLAFYEVFYTYVYMYIVWISLKMFCSKVLNLTQSGNWAVVWWDHIQSSVLYSTHNWHFWKESAACTCSCNSVNWLVFPHVISVEPHSKGPLFALNGTCTYPCHVSRLIWYSNIVSLHCVYTV